MKSLELMRARIARSLVTILALTLVQVISAPLFVAKAPAFTQGSSTNGVTTYGGGGGSPATTTDCSNGAITGISTSASLNTSLYITAFSYTCTSFNANATLSGTTITYTPLGTPDTSDTCGAGQVAIGINVREANNGSKYIAGVGLRCGNPMSQGSLDSRLIKPGVTATGGTDSSYTCPTGNLLVGFTLRTGGGVDQLIPRCAPFTNFVYAAVGAPSIVSSGPHTATIAFAAVTSNIADTPLSYTVTAVPTSGNTISVPATSSPAIVSGLASNMSYTFTVSGYNTYGTSAATGSTLLSSAPLPGGDTDTSLSLNGTSQYAWTETSSAIDITNAFTLEAWVKPETITAGFWNLVVCKEGVLQFGFQVNSGVATWAYGISSASTLYANVNTYVPVLKDEWHHVALSRATNSSTVDFFVDGLKVFTGTSDQAGTGAISTSSTHPFSIGGRRTNTGTSGGFFGGQIDHVRIFNTALTSSEISTDVNSYQATNTSGLVASYDFNEGTGSIVYNRKVGATNSLDLKFVDSPSWKEVSEVSITSTNPYTVVKFPRTYLTVNGGWKVPANVSRASILVVAGGGGGGSRHAGGGGAGGLAFGATYPLTVGQTYQVVVGAGGAGYGNFGNSAYINGSGVLQDSKAGPGGGIGLSGSNSFFKLTSSTTESITALGGGGGSGTGATGAGGSGGGSNQNVAGGTKTQYSGTNWIGYGNNGGQGASGTCNTDWCGGGGGGAGAVGQNGRAITNKPGDGGAGLSFDISGSLSWYAGGGGGGSFNGVAIGAGGSGVGGDGGNAAIGQNAKYGTGSGGGGGGFNGGTDYRGGNGATGVIIIRWITASKPTFTPPTNAYLNVGMTETFTTNVAADSATVTLTRTFRWESSTTGVNGTYTTIKQGTGASNSYFSWVPTDTSTSGSTFAYRVVVTDSDTAGLFIVDTSTAVWAIINRPLNVSGVSKIPKAINLAKSETFTITFGTSTYRPTLSPVISGITLDTSTAGVAVIKIADSMTVGTYYETLTVIDSVSASVVTPLVIKVSAPPNLMNTGEIVTNGLQLHLDAGNSQSLIGIHGNSTTGLTWNDLSGSKYNASTGAGVNTGANAGTACSAPTFSSDNGGAIVIAAASDNCYYTPYTGNNLNLSYTAEAWFKTSATIPAWSAIFAESDPNSGKNITVMIGSVGGANLIVGFRDSTTWRYANCPYVPTVGRWTHISGTFDGLTMITYIDGAESCRVSHSSGYSASYSNLGMIIGKGPSGAAGTYTFPGSIGSIRIYNRPLTAAEIAQNFNATKYRFKDAPSTLLKPTKKYGVLNLESFTATSGGDTKTITFAVGDRAGIDWDTTTVTNRINLSVQESLTVGTYYDTITVTDNLGQSTYLPITFTVTQADTLTITMGAPLTTVYTGQVPAGAPKAAISGLVGVDSATVLTRYDTGTVGTTCATGGVCKIGDTGPGGGKVFYVSDTVIDSATGVSEGGIYLEVAPLGWHSTQGAEEPLAWASDSSTVLNTSSAIGAGAENSRLIYSQLGSSATGFNLILNKTINSKSDWFVPSLGELQKIYTNLWATGLDAFTSARNMLSSTQDPSNSAQAMQLWTSSGVTAGVSKTIGYYMRPIRAFGGTTTTPVDVETYTAQGTNLTFSIGAASNYVNVVYETSTLKITQANQNKLTLNLYGAVAGSSFTLQVGGGSGTGAITETVTAGGSALNCRVSNKVLSNDTPATEQKTCNVLITKASSRNYKEETLTATVYFMVFANNQPTGLVGSGSTIAINGATSLTIDTATPPSITGFSTLTLTLSTSDTLTINGTGFTGSVTIKFWRNKVIVKSSPNTTTLQIPFSEIASLGATSGRVAVITANGEAVSVDSLTINP